MEIKALIFDLDGVLTDTAEYHFRGWKRLADEEGIPFTRTDNERLRGLSRRQSLEQLLRGRRVGEDQAQAMMDRKNRYYRDMIKRVTPDDILDGVPELLAELRAAGVKIAVASASKNARDVISRLGIDDQIDAVSDGYSVRRQKPATDLFLHAASQLGVPPPQCVVVEDAASGIEAAKAAGMWAVGIGPVERVGGADAVFPNLRGVGLNDFVTAIARGTRRNDTDNNWVIRENAFEAEKIHHKETIFTIGNGYLCTRGTFEERYPGDRQATLIHGVYDDAPLVYTELANAPDWLPLDLFVEGERLAMYRGEVLNYGRTLDLRNAVLARTVRWRSSKGHTLDMSVERWASLGDEHIFVIRCTIAAVDFDGHVELRAGLNDEVDNEGLIHWSRIAQGNPSPQACFLHSRTRKTGVDICQAAHLTVEGAEDVVYQARDCEGHPASVARFHLEQGQTATAIKLVVMYTSHDTDAPARAVQTKLNEAIARGYGALRADHEAEWTKYWETSGVVIEGDDEAELALRFSLFQLLIATPRQDDRVSIGGRTLSGFGYRGHVFWDTEIFILPFLIFTQPQLARNLLMYRYRTLPGARKKASRSGYEGAMYAWESARTGEETTPPWLPGPDGKLVRIWTGDLQHHVSADVAYAVWQYWRVTGDHEFLIKYGAEIILDTAVFWGSRVQYNADDERYEINDVIGPDEYHVHVNNSIFTNRMVQWHLQTALEVLAWLGRRNPDKATELIKRLDLDEERLDHWNDVISRLYIAYDPETRLMEQFEDFFDLEDIDLQSLEPRAKSIDEMHGFEAVQKLQAIKQPDVLMLLHLMRDDYDEETKRVNWNYYEPRTDHAYGSSLGPSIHAAMGCEVNEIERAYEHFMRAARIDLRDSRGDAGHGIHAASAGGLWQAAVFGFAGLKLSDNGYSTNPRLPAHWRRLAFRFKLRGEDVFVSLPRSTSDLHRGVS